MMERATKKMLSEFGNVWSLIVTKSCFRSCNKVSTIDKIVVVDWILFPQ